MSTNNHKKFEKIFEYVSASTSATLPSQEAPLILFGRNDELVAEKAGQIITAKLAEVVVITGGIGKDTGDLRERGYRSEAHYLEKKILEQELQEQPRILLDEKAKNGGENARFSLAILSEQGYFDEPTDLITAIHATSARRLAATVEREAQKASYPVRNIHIAPTDYGFDPKYLVDQHEATGELIRLADYAAPDKDFIVPQADLPEDLLEFAREVHPSLQNLLQHML